LIDLRRFQRNQEKSMVSELIPKLRLSLHFTPLFLHREVHGYPNGTCSEIIKCLQKKVKEEGKYIFIQFSERREPHLLHIDHCEDADGQGKNANKQHLTLACVWTFTSVPFNSFGRIYVSLISTTVR